MPPGLVRLLAAVVAVLVIVGFGFLYGYGIYRCWTSETPHTFKAEYVYVATALAGLVGGVVAMTFNEKLPDAPDDGKRPGEPTPSASGLRAGLTAMKRTILVSSADILTLITAAYVLIYFVTAVLAIITWVQLSDQTPDLIKNLALIGIGLFVAVARSFFNIPAPKGGS